MTWDYPVLLITALSLPLIILLHLLARRRKTLMVPSLLLWERLLENERRSVTLRHLIADLLLLLQILAAALLVLSMAGLRPARGIGRISGPTVLALDVSAGMSAVDENGTTRFELAMEKAEEMIRKKSPGAEVSILAGGSVVISLTDFTSDRGELLEAVKNQKPTDEPGKPLDLLRAAEVFASAKPGGRVVFITDGAFGEIPIIGKQVEILNVGSPAENSGITAFAVRGLPGGGRELLVTVENFGMETRALELSVQVDDRILLGDTILLSPDDRETRIISWQDPLAGRVSVRIKGEEQDALISDDGAYAVLAPGRRIRAALITPGNWFLETLLSTYPNMSLRTYRGIENWKEYDGPWDVIVADRLYPPVDPGIPLLAVYPFRDTPEPPLPLVTQGMIEGADPVSWDMNHPVMRDVDFSRVSVRSAAFLTTGPGVKVLAESSEGTLVSAGEDDRRRWIALSFDLLESSLPLRPAFPILISGALSWLVPGDLDAAAEGRRSGETWKLPPEFAGTDWEAFGPEGRNFDGLADSSPAIKPLDRTGFWTAWSEGQKAEIGVSLLSADESDLRPRWVSDSGMSESGPPASPDDHTPIRNPSPLTTVLIVLALFSIIAEWSLQTRYWRSA